MDKPCIITSDGDVREVEPKNGTDFTLEELQRIVDGNVEIIDIGYNQIMCMDEEGKIHGKHVNVLATMYASGHLFGDDVIVGDVLVCNSMMVK